MDAEDRDVGAVHGAAHVQAARQRDAQLGRQVLVRELVVERVHDRLDDARRVGGRRVAVDPALGVDDVADGVVGAAHREAHLGQRPS